MKKNFLLFSLLFSFALAHAQSQNEKTLDQKINEAVSPAANWVSSFIFYSVEINGIAIPIVVIWLIFGAFFFTIYMKFINFRAFGLALRITRGDYDNPNDKGEVSHFQALATALSGTVGLGNIAGVAVAISIGGPGATFWMIVAGLLGMTSKFIECTLGVKYRNINEAGIVSGGPMYYLQKGFAKINLSTLGKGFAIFFAIMCIGGSFGGGNMYQANQAAQQVIGVFHFAPSANLWVGVAMSALVAIVILGGVKSIAKVTDKIVPFMCGLYVLMALIVLGLHFTDIPATFGLIVSSAFSGHAITGGIVGVMLQGFKRATFSNEAGVGSASIAHSAVKTNEPVSEGIVALLEPFIDTVIICTMTALTVVITGAYTQKGLEGVQITSLAFSNHIPGAHYLLALVVFLFAFSTMISWSYYGLKAWTYLFSDHKLSDYSYKLIFCLMIIVGASMNLGSVIDFSDAMIFAMCVPNMIGMYLMAPEIKRDLNSYLQRIKSGAIRKYK